MKIFKYTGSGRYFSARMIVWAFDLKAAMSLVNFKLEDEGLPIDADSTNVVEIEVDNETQSIIYFNDGDN